MWQKRPEKEYRRAALKKGFTYLIKPWWITFMVIILALMCIRLYRGAQWVIDAPEVRTRIIITIACLALLLHMALAEVYRYFGQKNKIEQVICDKCHTVKNEDHNAECPCGGKFIDINRMQWIDEEIGNVDGNEACMGKGKGDGS
jgi:hypothetical protein